MQGLHLGNLGDAAEDDGAAQMGVAAVGVEALLDLQSELPGGGEDEGANRPGSPQRLPVDPANRIFCQALEDRQCERRRFAGPGLGAAHQIPSLQHRRDGLFLNGGRGGIPFLLHRFEQGGHQLQVGKFDWIHASRSVSSRAEPG